MTEFSEWITRKFVEWQATQGRRKTIEEFANFIGVSRPLINMWMNANQKPGKENIKLLAEIFGVEVYDSLGMERPNPYLERANRLWEFIPEERQKQIAEEAEQYAAQNLSSRIAKARKRRKARKAE
jgi:transcriptional regulator with XRE-family HTH domain